MILDTSADNEKEENMVEWLREVGMPADYVNKLARMFQDIKVSDDLNQNFKDAYRSGFFETMLFVFVNSYFCQSLMSYVKSFVCSYVL